MTTAPPESIPQESIPKGYDPAIHDLAIETKTDCIVTSPKARKRAQVAGQQEKE